MPETLLFEINDGLATITLNRPDNANALNLAMARRMADVANQCEQDSAIRAVLLRANGKMFCAGGDLRAFADSGPKIGGDLKQLTMYMHSALSDLTRMQKPLVTSVHGAAAGAGFSIAICGDIVLAGESAHFTMAYTAAGLSPDGGSTFLLPRLGGLRLAQELMLTNRRLSSEEAAQRGLITRVVADDELETESLNVARQLAAGPTRAFGGVKTMLQTSMGAFESQMQLEASTIAHNASGTDGQEGISAFLERRKPSFTGQP
ncbi:MAG: enoyl-CoA hydratase/isomerase family protein [Panacagrimonas sp.]